MTSMTRLSPLASVSSVSHAPQDSSSSAQPSSAGSELPAHLAGEYKRLPARSDRAPWPAREVRERADSPTPELFLRAKHFGLWDSDFICSDEEGYAGDNSTSECSDDSSDTVGGFSFKEPVGTRLAFDRPCADRESPRSRISPVPSRASGLRPQALPGFEMLWQPYFQAPFGSANLPLQGCEEPGFLAASPPSPGVLQDLSRSLSATHAESSGDRARRRLSRPRTYVHDQLLEDLDKTGSAFERRKN